MPSAINKISNSNDNFISFLENPIIKYSVLIFFTLLMIFIEKIDTQYLEVFDLDIVKIIYALVVAYTACFDPIYAIILTTFAIIAIQDLHSRRTKNVLTKHKMNETRMTEPRMNETRMTELPTNKVQPSFILSQVDNSNKTQSSQSVVYEEMPNNDILINDKEIYDLINKHSLQKTPDVHDTLVGEYDYYEDPAFRTITNNLNEKKIINKNQFLITDDDLANVQTNTQQGVNQNTSLKAFTSNILNIQGLPNGYDPKNNNISYM
jgi:hypothetical protein